MFIFWIVVPIAILMSVVLVVFVLLQPSKGGGVGGAFGNLNSQLGSTFGSRRTLDFLAKGTTWLAASLGALCLLANMFLGGTLRDTGHKTLPTQGNTAIPTAPPASTPPAPPPSRPGGGGAQPQQAPSPQQAPASGGK